MTCYISSFQGGLPDIFPLSLDKLAQMQTAAEAAIRARLTALDRAPKLQQYLGAALKTDGRPFYLSTHAPDLEPSLEQDWQGGFFAPFGVGEIHGSVQCAHGPDRAVTLAVHAALTAGSNELAAANWSILGSQHSHANKAALVRTIEITNPGPHSAEDIRRCIALHAPQRYGEPRAIVAAQCAVAVAALIEAIC